MKTFFKQNPIRLKGKEYTKFRKEVFEHFGGFCQDCGSFVPLLDHDGVFDVFTCGHVAHIINLSQGGSDVLENVEYKCFECHIDKEHGLKFSHREQIQPK